jgi:hypothetical protein
VIARLVALLVGELEGRQAAVVVAELPRDGQELVGDRGGRKRDVELPPSVERERHVLLHEADVEPGLIEQVENEWGAGLQHR